MIKRIIPVMVAVLFLCAVPAAAVDDCARVAAGVTSAIDMPLFLNGYEGTDVGAYFKNHAVRPGVTEALWTSANSYLLLTAGPSGVAYESLEELHAMTKGQIEGKNSAFKIIASGMESNIGKGISVIEMKGQGALPGKNGKSVAGTFGKILYTTFHNGDTAQCVVQVEICVPAEMTGLTEKNIASRIAQDMLPFMNQARRQATPAQSVAKPAAVISAPVSNPAAKPQAKSVAKAKKALPKSAEDRYVAVIESIESLEKKVEALESAIAKMNADNALLKDIKTTLEEIRSEVAEEK